MLIVIAVFVAALFVRGAFTLARLWRAVPRRNEDFRLPPSGAENDPRGETRRPKTPA